MSVLATCLGCPCNESDRQLTKEPEQQAAARRAITLREGGALTTRAITRRQGGALTAAALLAAACGDPAAIAPDAAPIPPDVAPLVDAPPSDETREVRLADTVIEAPGATGSGYGDSMRAVNGVRGGGTGNGSVDVFSLGYAAGENDFITLAWSNGRLRNGPGADLAVFENPFFVGTGTFMDLIIVEVSIDGVEFRALAHDYTATDPTVYSNDPQLWSGFAGRTPVLLHADTNMVDPFDQAAAGGDAFDLDTVEGDDALAQAIRADGVRFVRLISAPARIDPDTGAPYVHDAIGNGADIDGAYGRYVVAE